MFEYVKHLTQLSLNNCRAIKWW